MTNVNIALCGRLRSGKDAAASHIIDKYGYTRFAFGDELKRYAHDLFAVPADEKPRELYQWFGQTMREREPDVWVRKLFENIADTEYEISTWGDIVPFCVVITDCRQPNEFVALRDRSYTIIRVSCPEEIRIQRATAAGDVFDSATLNHDTESHIYGFTVDYEIVNDGTLAEMYAKVDEIIAEVNSI